MEFKHRMKLLLNDPAFKRFKNDQLKPQQPKSTILKNVFLSKLQVQRFKHLEQARVNTIEDMHLDKSVQNAIINFQQALIIYHQKDKDIQNKKLSFFSKLKMDYVQEQMHLNLSQLQKLVGKYQQINEGIQKEKNTLVESLEMTQIKKALKLQNQMLKSQNHKLKSEQKRIDIIVSNLNK